MEEPQSQPPPAPAPEPQAQSEGSITLNIDYVKSPRGIIKIVEIILLMIAFSCMADVVCSPPSPYYYNSCGRRSFFLFTTVVPWLICICIFLVYLLGLGQGLEEKIPQLNWPLTMMVNAIIWSLMILISSSLIADDIRKTADYYATLPKYFRLRVIHNNRYAAVAFGFFSLIAFVVDAVFQFRLYRS